MLPSGLCVANNQTTLWGIFDISTVPDYLFIILIPSVMLALIFSALLWYQSRKHKRTKILIWQSLALVLWTIMQLFTWTIVFHKYIFISYSLMPFVESIVVSLSIAFVLLEYRNTDGWFRIRTLLVLTIIPIVFAILTPTSLNTYGFYNFQKCDIFLGGGLLWRLLYIYELVAVIWMTVEVVRGGFKDDRDRLRNLPGVGFILCMALFFVSGVWSGITGLHQYELYRSLGVVGIWICIISVAVRGEYLGVKMSLTQVLIPTIWVVFTGVLLIQNPDTVVQVVKILTIPLTVLSVMAYRSAFEEHSVRRQMEKVSVEATKRNEELLALNQSKTDTISFISQQLRSPMAAIKWGIDTLRNAIVPKISESDKKILDQVAQTNDSMIKTVEDFLNVSKLDQGVMVLRLAKINISILARRVSAEQAPLAEQKKIALVVRAPEVLEVWIDEVKLQQVFANFLDNAIKYTENGSITLSVTDRDTYVRCEVIDTGRGVAPEESGKLFNKFERGKAGTEMAEGSGIGLYLAKQIVEMHGGNVGVTSPGIGYGSIFWFEIPKNELTGETSSVLQIK